MSPTLRLCIVPGKAKWGTLGAQDAEDEVQRHGKAEIDEAHPTSTRFAQGN